MQTDECRASIQMNNVKEESLKKTLAASAIMRQLFMPPLHAHLSIAFTLALTGR
jgi:hypothetical protein